MDFTIPIILLIIVDIIIIVSLFIIIQERKIRIVVDENDMDGFVKVVRILTNNALGIEYSDGNNIVMDVKIPRRKLKRILSDLNRIENIEAMEVK